MGRDVLPEVFVTARHQQSRQPQVLHGRAQLGDALGGSRAIGRVGELLIHARHFPLLAATMVAGCHKGKAMRQPQHSLAVIHLTGDTASAHLPITIRSIGRRSP